MTGFKAKSGWYVDNIAVFCNAVSFDWSSASNRFEHRFEGGQQIGPFGGDGGSGPHEYRCPGGQVVVGDQGRSGKWLDKIGFGCRTLTLEFVQ